MTHHSYRHRSGQTRKGADFFRLFNHHRGEAHAIGTEIIREVEFRGGAWLHADGRTIKLLCGCYARAFLHHEALTVIEIDAGEGEAERALTRHGPGGVARQDIQFAGLQHGEALHGGIGHKAHLRGITQQRSGNGAAGIHIQATEFAAAIRQGKARRIGGHTANQLTAGANGCHGIGRRRLRHDRRGGGGHKPRQGRALQGAREFDH